MQAPRDSFEAWLPLLVQRHTRDLPTPQFLKAVRALSARYVETREELSARSPTDSAGKRAAFAGFFSAMHFLTVREIVRALRAAERPLNGIVDLGCGTGAASAAWALEFPAPPTILGIDRDAWALKEASWNWRLLDVRGQTRRADVVAEVKRLRRRSDRRDLGIVLAWVLNELTDEGRGQVLPALTALAADGAAVLIVEPIARRAAPWWPAWADVWRRTGGQMDEWKLHSRLPEVLARLSRDAGFRRDWLGARTLWRPGAGEARATIRLMDHHAAAVDNEAALVAGLRAGDPDVYETIVRGQGPRLLSAARRILGNEEDAREAVQDAFVSAFRARHQFNAEARISTWLHRIAVNAALSRLRARRRHPEESLEDLLPRFLPDGHHAKHFTAWTEPADVTVSRKEIAEIVRDAINSLPESFRTVLMLRDIEGFTAEEAASMLGISANAVKLRLHRARMALRTLLAPHLQGAAS
jgi:RNA polymerase sigma-70 factor (ECF subfamily)